MEKVYNKVYIGDTIVFQMFTSEPPFKAKAEYISADAVEIECNGEPLSNSEFQSKEDITAVTVGKCCESVARAAFSDMPNLKTLTFVNSDVMLEEGAFDGVADDVDVEGVERPMKPAFERYYNDGTVYKLECEGDNMTLTSAMTRNEVGVVNNVTAVTIGGCVETIAERAFRQWTGLKSISIGRGVKKIDNYAFYYCYQVQGDFVIPNGVETIGNYAFYDLQQITSLTIPDTVKSIGAYAFTDCFSAKGDLVIPESVESIGEWAFNNCSALSSVKIMSDNVIPIGENAFKAPTQNPYPIYVRQELLEEYRQDPNWSVYGDRLQAMDGGGSRI